MSSYTTELYLKLEQCHAQATNILIQEEHKY
jgi:hypothetical protein